MASINALEVNVTGKAINQETNFVEQALTKEITFTEPTSQAELVIDNSNLSTVVTNENVKVKQKRPGVQYLRALVLLVFS